MKSIVLLFIFWSVSLQAGVAELGLSTSYHNSKIDDNNFSVRQSVTASLAYYFWEMSALEISYTSGHYESSTGIDASSAVVILGTSEFVGMDFVISFAGRKDSFQPFVKIGAIYMDKEYFLDPDDNIKQRIDYQIGVAPSAGLGFRIRMTQAFSVKFSVDTWSTPIGDDRHPTNYDYAARAGISWLF